MNIDQNSEDFTVLSSPIKEEKVVVEFKEEAGVRLTDDQFASITQADVSNLNSIPTMFPGCQVSRTFSDSEDTLNVQVSELKQKSGEKIPVLSCFYNVTVKDKNEAEKICEEFNNHPMVKEAYIEPPAVPAMIVEAAEMEKQEAPPATPDFSSSQGYLYAAPKGVDAKYAWTVPGGKGDKVQVIDIEGAWNFSHEDLKQYQGGVVGGTPTSDLGWENHGTAVHGEIGGDENGFGVIGISPKSRFSAVSIFGSGNSPANAIKTAADHLKAGDIILIELHRKGPDGSGNGQDGYIAIEWWPADFAATKYATAKGVIVIAAAGNGSRNLDAAVFQNRFNRSVRDSGAIIVGAGAPPSGHYGPDRSRLGFSNYGACVDAQGWGREVTTTGYGSLQGGSNKNKWYTHGFSGTSSASPIVVGAVACLQSVVKTMGQSPLGFKKLRYILEKTGSKQTAGPGKPVSQKIGNRPDLKQAINLVKKGQVNSGVATKYWDECLPYPAGSSPRLWLYVKGWKYLKKPNQETKDMVQRAFLGTDSNVRVWFDGKVIKGLVVEGK